MLEVIIFYSYIVLEFAVALLIFANMYCEHKRRIEEESERAREAAEDMEKAAAARKAAAGREKEKDYEAAVDELEGKPRVLSGERFFRPMRNGNVNGDLFEDEGGDDAVNFKVAAHAFEVDNPAV